MSEAGNKLRMLYLYQYLIKYSDPEHPITTANLTKMLEEEYGIPVSRNTISNDLKTLELCNLGISHYASKQNQYYYENDCFEVPELKLLIDTILSSKFLTEQKSEALIEKICTLTSIENAKRLKRHIQMNSRAKTDNEKGYYIVDQINEAILSKKKIRFYYTDYDIEKNRIRANQGKYYTVSPYHMLCDGDFYYLICYCHERKAMRTFRLDRIEGTPKIIRAAAMDLPKEVNLEDYNKTVFQMFDNQQRTDVTLVCDVSIMKGVIDVFGLDVETRALSDTKFEAKVNVCTSQTFYRWVFGWNGKMKIVGPQSARDAYKLMLLKALEELDLK